MEQGALNCSWITRLSELLLGAITVLLPGMWLAKTNDQRCKINGLSRYLPSWSTALFLWILMVGVSANAQSTGRANLTGVVTDPKGAVVMGAKITVTNTETNVTSVSVTNGTGYFEIDSLDAGIYKVTAAAPGFEGLVQSGIELRASSVVSLPLSLKLGRATDVVTVTTGAPLIDTESGLTGQSLTTREIESLPAADNDPMEFVEIGKWNLHY